jgi:hypothetical protein
MGLLYGVPQTDSATDPVMSLAVARFKASAPKAEAITGNGSGAIPDSTIALHLAKAYGRVRSALGDRLSDGAVLIQIDAALDDAALQIAALSLYRLRGYTRQAGTDNSIEIAGKEALDFLARCRPSGDANGKTENPVFVADDGVSSADAPAFTSPLGSPGGSGRSDAFIEARATLAGGRGGCG